MRRASEARRSATGTLLVLSRGFEELGIELVTLQELVELGAVALGEACRLGHVAFGDPEDLREILALEFAPGVFERRELALLVLDRSLHERSGNERRRRERDRLLHHVVELSHVAGPRRRHERFGRFRREAADAAAVL